MRNWFSKKVKLGEIKKNEIHFLVCVLLIRNLAKKKQEFLPFGQTNFAEKCFSVEKLKSKFPQLIFLVTKHVENYRKFNFSIFFIISA